jgi:WD40 repeat protein
MFLSQQARETEANLVPVREYILRSEEHLRVAALELFQKVIKKRSKVEFDNTNEVANLLQLSGMTRVDKGYLRVRNRIYEQVFDEKWVLSELPEAEARRIRGLIRRARLQAAAIATPIILTVLALAGEAAQQANIARQSELATKHALYVSDMRLASDSLDSDNINDTLELLGNHKNSDIAGFEYGYLWHQTHLATAVCTGHTAELTSVAFDPTGRFIATSSIDRTVRIWNTQSGRQIGFIPLAHATCSMLAFSPDGRWLALGCNDGSLLIYSATRLQLIQTLKFPAGPIWSLHISPDSQLLAVGSSDKIGIYRTNDWKLIRTIPSKALVYALRFDPVDSHKLATADRLGNVCLWNAETGLIIHNYSGLMSAPHDVAFSRDGKQLAAGSESGTAVIWNADTSKQVQAIDNNGQQVSALCFAPQAGELITADQNATIKYWNIATGKQTYSLHGHTSKIVDLELSNDGRHLATASWDKTAMVWDTSLRTSDAIPLQGYLTSFNSPALSQNGSRAAGLRVVGGIAVWDTTTGKQLCHIPEPRNISPLLAFVPNSDELITLDQHGMAYWNSNTGTRIQKASISISGAAAFAVSPNRHSIAVLHYSDPPQIIDVTTHHVMTLAVKSNAGLEALAFSADGTELAIGLRDGLVKIYDSQTGIELPELVGGLRGKISSISFSPDGRSLAISSEYKALKIWNLAARHETLTLSNPTGNLRAITFDDDGKTLKAISNQGVVTIWRASSVPK